MASRDLPPTATILIQEPDVVRFLRLMLLAEGYATQSILDVASDVMVHALLSATDSQVMLYYLTPPSAEGWHRFNVVRSAAWPAPRKYILLVADRHLQAAIEPTADVVVLRLPFALDELLGAVRGAIRRLGAERAAVAPSSGVAYTSGPERERRSITPCWPIRSAR